MNNVIESQISQYISGKLIKNRIILSEAFNMRCEKISLDNNETFVMGDMILLNWAFENIIKNSLDATSWKDSTVKINIFSDNHSIIIDITDNGKGISRNKWKKIFEPGFTSKDRGWGLGLSLTKRIIEDLHNGAISVVSSKPGLTSFRIKFNI